MIDLSIVLQAGGQSNRMGRDKGLVPFQRKPLLQFILDQIADLGKETIIISNQPAEYQQVGLPIFGDVYPDVGALGGLYSAIHHATQPYCLVLACDMPFVNRSFLEHLIILAASHDAVIPRLSPPGKVGKVFAEPFRAVYNKSCLQPIQTAIENGQRRVISFFDDVDIRFVERPEIEQFDPQVRSFFNINTPADLAEAERLALEMGKLGTDQTDDPG